MDTYAVSGVWCAGVLISVAFVHNPNALFVSMTGVGIAWASILSMPYAMLAPSLPSDKVGLYMGIFNFFIVLPEIACLSWLWMVDGTRLGRQQNARSDDRGCAHVVGKHLDT